MERLTRRIDGAVLIADDIDGRYTANEVIDMLAERLAAYEDTGGTPQDIRNLQEKYGIILDLNKKWAELGTHDHLRGLMTAEREGRLFILQIKPGDSVYWLLEDDGWYISAPEIVADVGTKGFYLSGVRDSDEPGDNPSFIPWDELGKSVFLSREEAEAALAKMKEG